MSGFLVNPGAVLEASVRLGTVTAGVNEVRGRIAGHVGAAAGTPAAGALDDLLGHFSHVLAQYSLASAELARAVGAAATGYRGTDGEVARACGAGEGGAAEVRT